MGLTKSATGQYPTPSLRIPDADLLRNVEKSYPHGVGRTYVLRRVNVDIKEGEFVSIMGPSGAGKSTLLHILGMHDSAWSGEYYFMDQPVHRLNPETAFGAAQEAHRVRVSELSPARQPDGVREPGDSALVSQREPEGSPEHGRPTSSIGSRSSGRRISIRISSRADSSSWSASRAPSSRTRR